MRKAKKEKLFTLTNVLLALCLVFFLISFAVTVVLNFRSLYYSEIERLDIPAMSGLAPEEIRENYDALIDYNSLFYRGGLRFPSLPMSQSGEIHFEEVKVIFDGLQVLAIASGLLLLAGIILKLRKGRIAFLKLGAILSVVLPAVVAGLIGLNWDAFFVLFHKLFFNNDYWIFDAVTDPVIIILPDAFFMHCALAIVGVVLVGAAAAYVVYRVLLSRNRRRMPEKNGEEGIV